jgi:xanthine/uracil/vitamin C permease (AzgA family)
MQKQSPTPPPTGPANAKTIVELGNVIGEIDLQLCLAGILLVASLLYHDVKGAILIAIAVLTVVDWAIHNAWPTQIFQVPVFHSNDYWQPSVLFDLTRLPSCILPSAPLFSFASLTFPASCLDSPRWAES